MPVTRGNTRKTLDAARPKALAGGAASVSRLPLALCRKRRGPAAPPPPPVGVPAGRTVTQGRPNEASLPAERPQARQASRFPSPHVDARRASHPRRPAPKGTSQAVGLSFVRPARLGGREAFRCLAASNVRARSGPVGIRWAPPGTTPAVAIGSAVAIGFAVTTRQGSAVVRNRMRRRVRSIVGEVGGTWPPGNYLITLEAPTATMAHGKLREHVERAVTLLDR